MKYDAKLLIKLSLIFFGLLFLVCIWLGRRESGRVAPEGEKIAWRDVVILLEALDIHVNDEEEQRDVTAQYLTYEQYMEIYQKLDGETLGLPDYIDRYEPAHEMLRSDWYDAYRRMLAYLDRDSSVWETEIFLLKIDEEACEAYTENSSDRTPYHYESEEFGQNVLRKLRVYVNGDSLLTVVEALPGEQTLENVWITESTENMMECFYRQITFQTGAKRQEGRECVADLTFRDGNVVRVKEKNEKIHGKLLWVSEDELEIENSGIYPIAEHMEVYKLYGSLKTLGRTDLRIGYADTDYVVEKGKICACLVSENEAADRIRVLLKNTAQNSNYYDTVELTVDGERVRIEEKDLEVGERRTYRCAALTDRITLNIEGVQKDDNAYRGAIECYRSAEGMVLINELPLEEYLYAVVPSEMPASYPMEALKAQAVCARTYAYRYILHAGLPELGAHVDDTTSYQVYHNSGENTATTTAVKETDGVLLVYQGEPAQNYYYSTSCGAGTDAGIWRSGSSADLTYIQAEMLNREAYLATDDTENHYDSVEEDGAEAAVQTAQSDDSGTADDLRDEEVFQRFITSAHETDIEKDEPWYRWTYTVDDIDTEAMLARIKARYAASPESVLTKTEGAYYVSQPIEELGDIRELSIHERGAGGVVQELLIVTDTGTYKILAEYNIRAVLCDSKSEVIRQDGSTIVPAALLPSGFFVIETGKNDRNVIGYRLIGGGYGHGVGMSQNGAKALGEQGATSQQILEFFFRGCELDHIGRDSDL